MTGAVVVGIDLGTSHCAVAVLVDGRPVVVADADGHRTTPSTVSFTPDRRVLVGRAADGDPSTGDDRMVRSVPDLLGTEWSFEVGGETFSAPDVGAYLLRKLVRDAERHLGTRVTHAVVTVPAYADAARRRAVREAGDLANLHVSRVIPESTAAGLAHGLVVGDDECTLLVVDLGAGALSVGLLQLGDGVVEVMATAGDGDLGGRDWDGRIADRLAERFRRDRGVDLAEDPAAMRRLRETAEQLRIALSDTDDARVVLPSTDQWHQNAPALAATLTREVLEHLGAGLLARCRSRVLQVLAEAEVEVGQVDQVLLAGGASRMPAVRAMVAGVVGERAVFVRAPEATVAMGAALQGGVLYGEVKDVLPLDVNPLPLGVRTKGDVMTALIPRNMNIPNRRVEMFTTAEDDQPSTLIEVFQGEYEAASRNRRLGTLELTGIAPAPRGVPQIEVVFDVDANGILTVSATDRGSGGTASVTIGNEPGSLRMPKEEVADLGGTDGS